MLTYTTNGSQQVDTTKAKNLLVDLALTVDLNDEATIVELYHTMKAERYQYLQLIGSRNVIIILLSMLGGLLKKVYPKLRKEK